LGAAEVGMLRALSDAGIRPDLVVGTSIGAVNGAAIAAHPGPDGVVHLRSLWTRVDHSGIFGGSFVDRMRHLARTRTSLHSNDALRRLIEDALPQRTFEELAVPFQCVAACIETSDAEWFSAGDPVSAVLASCAVPGLLPAVRIGDRHYLDGGIVESIPVRRALELGADEVYVLQVGRIEQPLTPPTRPHEVAMVAFEIARRRSFASAMADLPDGVRVHVLPTGGTGPRFNDLRQLRYRDFSDIDTRIDQAADASAAYLADHVGGER
jgi:NTE family protein